LQAVIPRLQALPSAHDPRELARRELELRISAHIPFGSLTLTVTDNRYTMISVKRHSGRFRLRLHHMFLTADHELVRVLARYVSANDQTASRVLNHFIDRHQREIRKGPRRRSPQIALEPRGAVHDLTQIYDQLNGDYFEDRIQARITWGQRAPAGKRMRRHNSIKMGSYSVEDRLIRIHPSLDRPFVPSMFVAWIVFHEMLHQKHDIPTVHGRRQYHTPAFLHEEATYARYEEARRWEHQNLDRLLVF
jgi:hypothetical protein